MATSLLVISDRDREFGIVVGLEIDGVCPVHTGVELGGVAGAA